jgi:hypothetical protein
VIEYSLDDEIHKIADFLWLVVKPWGRRENYRTGFTREGEIPQMYE